MPLRLRNLINCLTIAFIATYLYACVPAKQFESLQSKNKNCEEENAKMKDQNHSLSTENTELRESMKDCEKNMNALAKIRLRWEMRISV
jgi:septal ring factor EnvC (AmiA/AmiB activator)